jgi:hypothetical protein
MGSVLAARQTKSGRTCKPVEHHVPPVVEKETFVVKEARRHSAPLQNRCTPSELGSNVAGQGHKAGRHSQRCVIASASVCTRTAVNICAGSLRVDTVLQPMGRPLHLGRSALRAFAHGLFSSVESTAHASQYNSKSRLSRILSCSRSSTRGCSARPER